MRRIALIAICGVLTACSGGTPSAREEAVAANRVEAFGGNDQAAAVIKGLPKSDDVRPAVAARQLSPAFQGRWGITPNDCDFSRRDTRGLLTVFADRLSFYDSNARIDRLAKQSQARVTVDLTFTAEGKTWQRRNDLELILAGTVLLRQEQAATYRYERC